MSELSPSKLEHSHSLDAPGRNADMPFVNHQLGDLDDVQIGYQPDGIDWGDLSYDGLPDYGADSMPDDAIPGYDDETYPDLEDVDDVLEASGSELKDVGTVPEGMGFVAMASEAEQKPPISDQLDTALQYYLNGASKDDLIRAGIDPSIVTAYVRSRSEEEQAYLKDSRRAALQHESLEATIEANLEASAPELLKGRLPKTLADRIGSDYALGLRQLGVTDVDDARQRLAADGGVDVSDLGLKRSFEVIKKDGDEQMTKGLVINGYYGAERGGGKFVIAVPVTETTADLNAAYEAIPDMRQRLKSSDNPSFRAVNPKYVAGFIDGQGVFHANQNFMGSAEAQLVVTR